MHPKPNEWDALYEAMKRKSGLDLNLYKASQLQRRILAMAEQRGAKSLEEFWKILMAQPDGVQWFMDKLAINVSELFRNPEKFVDLQNRIIPELLKRSPSLNIWSAGCSYGAEAHSLACIIQDRFKGSAKILGTDIDKEALDQARAGLFSAEDMRGVPADYAKSYFAPEGKGYKAKDSIRKLITFRSGNLLADRVTEKFDLILCRNVVIYFTDEAKDALYQKFYDALKPGGYLLVGSTERILNFQALGFSTEIPFFYQKAITGNQQTWRNAS